MLAGNRYTLLVCCFQIQKLRDQICVKKDEIKKLQGEIKVLRPKKGKKAAVAAEAVA